MEVNQYTYQISWDRGRNLYVGRVAEFQIRAEGRSQTEVLETLKAKVQSKINDLERRKEEVIKPFSLTQYSGRFNIRIPPELHRELTITAGLQGVALNQLIMGRLMHHRALNEGSIPPAAAPPKTENKSEIDAYIYPTRDTWIGPMLQDWVDSGQARLCFPFLRFRIRVLDRRPSSEPFWLYMYYSTGQTKDPEKVGLLAYRARVVFWGDVPDEGNDVYRHCTDGDEKFWFTVDLFQRIATQDQCSVTLCDFRHVESKRLSSTLRTSIAPVECLRFIKVVEEIAP